MGEEGEEGVVKEGSKSGRWNGRIVVDEGSRIDQRCTEWSDQWSGQGCGQGSGQVSGQGSGQIKCHIKVIKLH